MKGWTRSEELQLIVEDAIGWLQRLPAGPKSLEGCLNWLMESPLHIREALAAIAWDKEIGGILDPDRRIDADALVAKAASNNMMPIALRHYPD